MNLKSFKNSSQEHPKVIETLQIIENHENKIHWAGLVGSAKSVYTAAVASQCLGHHVFVLDNKEDAAYFLNDLQGIYPDDKRLVFYPASYRTPYQIEDTDNASVVARTEALKKLSTQKNCWVVTYPEALFEKVLSVKKLKSNTMKIEVDKTYSIEFINELLLEYNFEQVNYVYEPGQYSIRGGIVDVFSFASDTPYRIEFFGNEVESIRTFDAASQLSISSHSFFTIVPNIQGELLVKGMDSFFRYLKGEKALWLDSVERTLARIQLEFDKAQHIYNEIENKEKLSTPEQLFLNEKECGETFELTTLVEFNSNPFYKGSKKIEFSLSPQPSFNKNFDLLKEDLIGHQKNKYTNFLFSNQPKQIERLYQIFEDIGAAVEFTSMNSALHEGFICKDSKIVVL